MRKRGEMIGEFSKNKSGQVTLFIIIGIVIVVAGLLIYFFYPQIKTSLGLEVKSPNNYMQDCLQDKLKIVVDKMSIQGGAVNPTNYISYKDQKIQFLCYVGEYYKPCVMQNSYLQGAIESEIKSNIESPAKLCFDDMKKSYESAGYNVDIGQEKMIVQILPKKVALIFNNSMTLSRGTESKRFVGFHVILNNNIYELTSIAESILNWEAQYGDVETMTYMSFYKDLKVEKYKQTDGSKIYILTNRNTGDKFQFATRSYAFPAGY